jgi:hypothetical protein
METNNRNDFTNQSGRNGTPRTIYERAARYGVWFGVWFTVLFALSVVSMHVPLLNIVAMMMALMVPYFAFRFQRKTFVDSHGLSSFSAIWLQGILSFAGGSLILCATSYVYMRWMNPDFILDTVRMGIDFYNNDAMGEAGAEIADQLQMMVDLKLLPQPVTVSVMWLWLGLFSGLLLSLVLAMAVRLIKVPIK